MEEFERLEVLKEHLQKIDEVIEQGPYAIDNWDDFLDYKIPDWYKNGKFGIFIHWGPYCVPAFTSEKYPKRMYMTKPFHGVDYKKHHEEHYGQHKEFGYKDFIPLFRAENFDAAEWVALFKEAGAKFVMPVAEHHDGFQMYNSALSEWNAVEMGPKKDILGLLKQEIEENDLIFAASSHRVEHYWYLSDGRDFDSDISGDIPYGHIYWPSIPNHEKADVLDVDVDPLFMEDWLARTCEIVDRYQPKVVWFDWWIQVKPMKPYLRKFMAYYYTRAKEWDVEVTINYKNDAFMQTTAVQDIERGQLTDISPYFWQNDTSVAKNTWGYCEQAIYKTPREIVSDLIDVVSKNGAMLLNIDPKSDGTIPEPTIAILKEIGKWLKQNGEGIYGTKPFRMYGEGPTKTLEGHFTDVLRSEYTEEDFRFTFKNGKIYVFCMKWPQDGIVRIKTFGHKVKKFNAIVKKASILGQDIDCAFTMCDDYLTIVGKPLDTKMPVCIQLVVE